MTVKCISEIFTFLFNHFQSLYLWLEFSQFFFIKWDQLLIWLVIYSCINWFLQERVFCHKFRFLLFFYLGLCSHTKIFLRTLEVISWLFELSHITESHFFDLSHGWDLISFSFKSIVFTFGSSDNSLFLKGFWFFISRFFRAMTHGTGIVIVVVEMKMLLTIFWTLWFFAHCIFYCISN